MTTLDKNIGEVEQLVDSLTEGKNEQALKLLAATLAQYMASKSIEGFSLRFLTTENEEVKLTVNIEVAE